MNWRPPAQSGARANGISPRGAKAAIDSGEIKLILDVREPAEWVAGKIEGATHIPLGQILALQQREGDVPGYLKGPGTTLVYCAHGVRSQHAAQALGAIGARPAVSMDGGLAAWVKADLPMIGHLKL